MRMYIVRNNHEEDKSIVAGFSYREAADQFVTAMPTNCLVVEYVDSDNYQNPEPQVEYTTTVPIYSCDGTIKEVTHSADYVKNSIIRNCAVTNTPRYIKAVSVNSLAESKRRAVMEAVDHAYRTGSVDSLGKPILCFDDPEAEYYFHKDVPLKPEEATDAI